MKKLITPSDPNALVFDPARGRNLPPEGVDCLWNVHWARLERRGDVTVSEPREPDEPGEAAGPAEEPAAADGPATTASEKKPRRS